MLNRNTSSHMSTIVHVLAFALEHKGSDLHMRDYTKLSTLYYLCLIQEMPTGQIAHLVFFVIQTKVKNQKSYFLANA